MAHMYQKWSSSNIAMMTMMITTMMVIIRHKSLSSYTDFSLHIHSSSFPISVHIHQFTSKMMLSGLFCLQLVFKLLFSLIKIAGTCVFKHFGEKQRAKSYKSLVTTQFKAVWSGKEAIHMVEYDGKIQELIVRARHASSPVGY
jgi:hypothetical protein